MRPPAGDAERLRSGTIDGRRFEVWALDAGEIRPAQLDLAPLDSEERERAALMAPGDKRVAYLAGRLLLRQLLAEATGCPAEEIVLGRSRCPVCGGPNGRPVVALPAGRVEFSLSRGGGQVAVGIAPVPIGLDVEALPGPEVADEVAALLHPLEQSEIEQAPPEARPYAFARVWTRKEAYLKGLGCGLAHQLPGTYAGTQHPASLPTGWTFLDLPAGPGHVASVALGCPESAVRVDPA